MSKQDRSNTLVDTLRERVASQGDKIAYIFLEDGEREGGRLSFADLDRRARAIGAHLQETMAPGERALILYPPSLDYIAAFFGCLYAGVIAVPAYPPDPTRLQRTLPRLQAIVDDARATVALTTEPIAQMAEFLAMESPGLATLRWVATDVIDDELAARWQPPTIDAETLAFLQYTSGSTGNPKGVMLDHRTLLKNEALIEIGYQAAADDVIVSWLPLYHDMGLIGGVILPVYKGCTSVVMSPLDFLKKPQRWLEAFSKYRGTLSAAPNFAFDLCVRRVSEEVLQGLDLSCWEVACNGAEPVRMSTVERFADYFAPAGFQRAAFSPSYGLAEVGLLVSTPERMVEPVEVEIEGVMWPSCGQPVGDFEVKIVNPDTLQACEDGQVGEIWLAGGSVARGYWERPEVNQEVFGARLRGEEQAYLRTGDLGALKDGELVVTGRLKDLVVIRGVNHYPQDLEATVEGVDPGLRAGCGAAFALSTEGEERLVVVHEIDKGAVDRADEIIASVRRALVKGHEVNPFDVVLIKARTIEKTSSGKIQRRATRNAYEHGTLDVIASAQRGAEVGDAGSGSATPSDRAVEALKPAKPVGDVALWLRDRVAQEAGVAPAAVSLRAPFANYGLGSAEAVGLVGELEERFGVTLSATTLYDFPTIAELARHVEGAGEGPPAPAGEASETRGARREADALEGAVAIVGMACRFPKAEGVEAFWQMLHGGECGISEVPGWRWRKEDYLESSAPGYDVMVSARGGFVEGLDHFDASFFGISPREARAMDPQQRLVMEVAWHALEDAGLSAERLARSRTGVFIGQSGSDFARLYQGAAVRAGTGLSASITANRLSYAWDLRGPSQVVDTACSSSLVALDQAVLNLRAGRCDQAVVGGVNAILDPQVSVAFSQAGMLSPEGLCKTFDEGANGYVRGEGCGVVVVKRLEDALAAGDRIWAVVRGTAVNQDGQTNGLTAPNGRSQQAVIEEAWADAGLERGAVDYVEAHGTGTELGDAIEAQSLQKVFGVGRAEEASKVALGSVKTNVGHLEAAAGMAGLIKVALMLSQKTLVPHLNFERPSAASELVGSALEVVDSARSWEGQHGQALRAGLSGFGFGGTNAHVVLESAPEQARRGAVAQPGLRVYERKRFWPKEGQMLHRGVDSCGPKGGE
ncbi:beta-ketoacyl synthase N-terminal-like domain-containing protein [Lujinxingia litoralis]|uniref:beta-ketoacyl synthase N-terminal-like domain-containing protein n=1 Tax=Lujinxingia litoralis TaxID=2211119 RepID=UPI0011B938F7|nr:beta-ketoacyl synthase N-terminal-like domain-containing protein [Lujinxingia litoralis]